MNNLKNFPSVYYISLEDSYERQKGMNLQLDLLRIENRHMIIGYDGRTTDYKNHSLVEGMYFHQLDSGQIAVGMSHLRAIKEWYYQTDEPYAVFLEDDMTFETSRYWNFTWEELLNSFPENWKVVQLSLIKENGIEENDMNLQKRQWWFWSAGAYLLKREYAKVLIDNYCDGDKYNLTIHKDTRLLPIIENLIYLAAGDDVYTIPLFTEDVTYLSTFYPDLIQETHKGKQIECSKFILNWWKTNGKNFSIKKVESVQKNDISNYLYDFISNPQSPEANYNLGICYENMGQTASAISYYLRTAERTQDKLMQYNCLLRAALCFNQQGSRNFTVKGLLQNAITILPKRPEGYYLLAKFYNQENKDGSWNDCYLISTIAESIVDKNCESLVSDVTYPGYYGILFYKAISGWWCGLCSESKKIFTNLLIEYDLSKSEIEICKEYLNK